MDGLSNGGNPFDKQDAKRYRTIVADPPWDHSDGTGLNFGSRWNPRVANNGQISGHGDVHTTGLPYSVMTLDEICALPVGALAESDAHLYLWTTNRYLRASFSVIEAWGFSVSATLVWCKAPKGFMGGAFRSSTEFIQFARRGSLPHKAQAPQRWFQWPRIGHSSAAGTRTSAGHSAKPEAFLDLVEQVSPGPYLELFARRNRFGWDTWGNECLEHVEMGGAA
jgi:N6-adenosine-specific RNA methylase IME4